MNCSDCGKEIKRSYPNGLCQACYNYYRKGGTVSKLPKPGTIEYDERGYVVCHICGKSFKKLGSHAMQSHGLSVYEYKKKFGLCNNSKTTERKYSEVMSGYAYKYNMPQQLNISGMKTRLRKGNKLRAGRQTRLQENLEKRGRPRAV